jgi:2-methylisocitrate lyase-like PEP mutase family enzyme
MIPARAMFRSLHEAGIFVMPNPWDPGSARLLESAGFPALATTSAGFGRSIGKDDQEVSRDELVDHVADLVGVIHVPLNVDSERLFPEEPGGIAETVRLLARAGASGCSIEDYDPTTRSIDTIETAAEAVAEAAVACAEHGMVLTARAENHLYLDTADSPAAEAGLLDDTITRLRAYAAAGADVLYAPGLRTAADIRAIVEAAGLPVNVLAVPDGPSVPELGALGVRRVSIGSSMYNATMRALKTAASELIEHGTSHYAR